MDPFYFGAISDPFPDSEAFYEFFMRNPASEHERAYEAGLSRLPFDSPIVFTHSDLNPSNILITPRGVNLPVRVLAVIDWEQSGWMPSFWEYSKPKYWMMTRSNMGDMGTRLREMCPKMCLWRLLCTCTPGVGSDNLCAVIYWFRGVNYFSSG